MRILLFPIGKTTNIVSLIGKVTVGQIRLHEKYGLMMMEIISLKEVKLVGLILLLDPQI